MSRRRANTFLLAVIAVLLGVNVVLLAVLLARDTGETTCPPCKTATVAPAPAAVTNAPATTAPPPPGTTEDPVATFLSATLDPLARAAKDQGVDPAQIVPTEAEIDTARASGSLTSEASQRVLEKMKTGYARFNMPFPEVRLQVSTPPGAGPGTPDRPVASGNAPRKEILRAYFAVTRDRLVRGARAKDIDVNDCLPDEASVQAAIESGAVSSEAAHAVIDKLREGYKRVGLAFPEPMDGT